MVRPWLLQLHLKTNFSITALLSENGSLDASVIFIQHTFTTYVNKFIFKALINIA